MAWVVGRGGAGGGLGKVGKRLDLVAGVVGQGRHEGWTKWHGWLDEVGRRDGWANGGRGWARWNGGWARWDGWLDEVGRTAGQGGHEGWAKWGRQLHEAGCRLDKVGRMVGKGGADRWLVGMWVVGRSQFAGLM